MDNVTIIRVVAGFVALAILVAGVILYVLYILALSRALKKCSESSRTIQPGTLWLLLIPLVNLVWHFFVVLGMAKSLGNEFRGRNILNVEPEPGKAIGMGMCLCGACSIIPILGVLAGLAHFVLLIIYWIKINEYSRLLDQTASTGVMPTSAPAV
ncbi:MAG: DUF4328 domain-containing protein [Silvibacterium sp.]